jgi:hypothetical protein
MKCRKERGGAAGVGRRRGLATVVAATRSPAGRVTRREGRSTTRERRRGDAERCGARRWHGARLSSARSSRTARCSEAAEHLQMASSQKATQRRLNEERRAAALCLRKGSNTGRAPQGHRAGGPVLQRLALGASARHEGRGHRQNLQGQTWNALARRNRRRATSPGAGLE